MIFRRPRFADVIARRLDLFALLAADLFPPDPGAAAARRRLEDLLF